MYEIKVTFINGFDVRERIELYPILSEAIDRIGILLFQGCKEITIKKEDDLDEIFSD